MGISAGIQKGITAASNALNNWVLQNFGIDLAGLEGVAKQIAKNLLTFLGANLTAFSRQFIDPAITSIFKADN